MNIEQKRRGLLAQILGATAISVALAGCGGGSSQSAGPVSDASGVVAINSPVGRGSASNTVASTPVASTSTPSSSSSSSSGGSSSGATTASSSSGGATTSGADNVTLSWSAPTENTNGSALTNLAGYVIYYGTSANAMTQTIDVNTTGMLTYVVSNLSAGNWYFQIVSVNSAGVQSSPSSTVTASI
jgi:hypothetical protein